MCSSWYNVVYLTIILFDYSICMRGWVWSVFVLVFVVESHKLFRYSKIGNRVFTMSFLELWEVIFFVLLIARFNMIIPVEKRYLYVYLKDVPDQDFFVFYIFCSLLYSCGTFWIQGKSVCISRLIKLVIYFIISTPIHS